MKKPAIILIIVILGLSLTTTPVWAGSKQRHRWQGAAIGIGAVLLGHAILHPRSHAPAYPQGVYQPPPKPRHGHWKFRKVWVPPTCRTVWNPEHYNGHGEWVPGQYIEIIDQPGYWTKRRVWVTRW